MADLTMSVSSISSTKSASDTNANKVLSYAWKYLNPNEDPSAYTAQQRLDNIVNNVAEYLRDIAQQQEELEATVSAQAGVAADPPIWS